MEFSGIFLMLINVYIVTETLVFTSCTFYMEKTETWEKQQKKPFLNILQREPKQNL